MLTKPSDYSYVEPPAGRICGDIVPIADVDGRPASLRFEDVCYLREMMHDFYEGSLSDRDLPAGLFPKGEDLATVWSMCSSHYVPNLSGGVTSTKLSAAIPAEGLESATYDKKRPSFYADFLVPLADTNPEFFLTAPFGERNPFLYGGRMDADDARLLYWFMSRPRYDGFTLKADGVSGPYECAVEQPLSFVSKTFSGGSGHTVDESSNTVEVDGVALTATVGEMHSLYTYADGTARYWLRNGCPQSDVVGLMKFADGVEIAAAFMGACYSCAGGGSSGRAVKCWLEPMARAADGAWEFRFFDVAKGKSLVASLGLAWDDAGPLDAEQEGWTMYVEHARVFAMVGNRATDLPAEWDWTPGD